MTGAPPGTPFDLSEFRRQLAGRTVRAISDFRSVLADVPHQRDPTFAFAARDAASMTPKAEEFALQLLADTAESEEIRFVALYIILNTYWRNYQYQRYADMVARHAPDFDAGRHPYVNTFYAQARAEINVNIEALREALDYADVAARDIPGASAVLNLAATMAVRVAEIDRQGDVDVLDTARNRVVKAIRIDGDLERRFGKPRYSGYHATLARVLTQQGRFSRAHEEIRMALELESVDHGNPARLGRFESIKLAIDLERQRRDGEQVRLELQRTIDKSVGEARDLTAEAIRRFEQIRLEVVQILALLAAVLAFLITGVQSLGNRTFSDAAALLVLVSGTLQLVFGGFAMLFAYPDKGSKRVPAVLVLGLALLAGSVAAHKLG